MHILFHLGFLFHLILVGRIHIHGMNSILSAKMMILCCWDSQPASYYIRQIRLQFDDEIPTYLISHDVFSIWLVENEWCQEQKHDAWCLVQWCMLQRLHSNTLQSCSINTSRQEQNRNQAMVSPPEQLCTGSVALVRHGGVLYQYKFHMPWKTTESTRTRPFCPVCLFSVYTRTSGRCPKTWMKSLFR